MRGSMRRTDTVFHVGAATNGQPKRYGKALFVTSSSP
jgi:hypothetical protein